MTADKTISTIRLLVILLLISPPFCLWIQAAGAAPSLSITKTVSSTGYPTGSPGASSNFEIYIINTGDSNLSSVVLTDLMPNGITFTGSTLTPSSNTLNENGSSTITWNIGNMKSGGNKTVYPRGTRNGRVFGPVVNYAAVTGKDQTGKTVLASKSYGVTVLKPNIRIVESASPSSGASCAELTYSIKVFNTGEDSFSSVRFSDFMPKGLSYVTGSAVPAPNSTIIYDNGTTNLTWNNLGPIKTDPKIITLKARMTGEAFGQLTDSLRVIAKPPKDAYRVVNTTSTNVQALRSGVELSENVSPSSGSPGTIADFAINISNTGEVPLRLELTDTIPEGLTFISSNPAGSELGRTIKWDNLGNLAPGSSIPVRLTANIDDKKYGTLVNRASVTGWSPSGCNVTDEDSLDLTSYRSGLQINETPILESGAPGSIIDFKIDITNTGDVNLNAINLKDLLPNGVRYSSASVDPTENKVEENGTTSVVWNNILAAPLAPNASVSIYLVAVIDGSRSGSLQNKISAKGLTPAGFNVTAEDSKSVTAFMPAVHVAETATPDSGCPGTLVDFRIDLTNVGEVNLQSLRLVDLLPKGLRFKSASIDPVEKKINDNGTTTISWNDIQIGPLAPGNSTSIHLLAEIDGAQFGTIQNSVVADVTSPDGSSVSVEDKKGINAYRSAIAVAETPAPASGSPGTLVDFKVDLTNTGEVDLNEVNLVDILPKGLRYSSASISPTENKIEDNGTTSIVWGNVLTAPLAPDASASIHLFAAIDGTQCGSIQNKIRAVGTPPTGYNVTAEVEKNIMVYISAVLVSLTSSPDQGVPGTLVDLRIDVTNAGEVNLDIVKLADLLPKGLSYSSASVNPTERTVGATGDTSLTWNNILNATLQPNASATVHLTAIIDGTQFGPLQNAVTVTGKPPTGSNVTTEIRKDIIARRSAIEISETPIPESGCPGNLVDFKIDITNTGDVNLDAVKVVDLLPTGLKYSSASIAPNKKTVHHNQSTSVTWNNILTAPLTPNASTSFHLVSKIDGMQSGSLQNTITATGTIPTGDDITAKDEVNITACKSAIQVVAVPTPESGILDTSIDFRIDITNTGDTYLDALKLVDLLPKGLKYSSASIDPTKKRVNHNKTTSVTWNNVLTEPLAPKAYKSIHIAAAIDGTQLGLLQDKITATGRTSEGFNVTGEDRRDITAFVPAIEVALAPTPESGSLGTIINFKIDIINTGDVNLDEVKLVDLLPKGLNYSSASIDPDSNQINSNGSRTIIWNNISNPALSPGSSASIHLNATIDGTAFSKLQNEVMATGKPQIGECIYGTYGTNSATVEALQPIRILIAPTPGFGSKGTNITFDINITNQSNFGVSLINIADSLPGGLKYVSSDPVGSEQGNTVTWSVQGELAPGRIANIKLVATIDGSKFGELNNNVTLSCNINSSPCYKFVSFGSSKVNALTPMLTVSKTASKKVFSPGEDINYTILLANTGKIPVKNVLVRDNFDSRIEFVSASPLPDSNGVWHFSLIEPGSSVIITLTVRVPVAEINFNADQKIIGDGFVNVANKFSTTQEQYYLNNQVYVAAEDFEGHANEKVTISSAPGTELQANEHGSGSYSSNAILQLHSKNRSVEVEKILSARTKPTTFALPRNRLAHFSSKWSDRTSAKNRISGTSTEESYRYADKIEHKSKIKLDKNVTDIAVRTDFEGDAHLGFLRKPEAETGCPTFESKDYYSGRFRIFQDVNEYGEDVRMNGSANGTGSVNADKHIRQSQRTYESGSGDYRIEELIDTPTSFMAKKIRLNCHPVRYGYMSGMNITSSAGWKEGMWSKIKDTGYIVEEFEDIQRLKKTTTAKGLNQMETEANFSGRARFGARSGDNLKLDQENNGVFSIKRNLLLRGVASFDRPHISVIKGGQTKTERINDVNITVAEYKIDVHNDGNTALGPVRITDLFPPGTEFINSSIMPIKTDSGRANWTLMNLGIGSSITIGLWLKAEPDSDLVNRVNVAGGYGDKWVTASNISTIEKSWLGCCPPEIYLTETARIDPLKKTVVWYNITLKNRAKSTMTAVVTDHIPDGMRFLNSSMVPSKQSQNAVKWMVMDLAPGVQRSITYRAEASRDGKFIDLVHVDAILVHGQGSVSSEASAEVVVGPTPGKTGKSGTDSSNTEVICPNEPPSDYNWNQEPLAECPGPCPAFSESSNGDIP